MTSWALVAAAGSAPDVATVPLALFDFVPVALAGIGAVLLARSLAARVPALATPALIGAALIVLGGVCKAGWKLDLALTGSGPALVDDLLFVLLAPGFALLAWALLVAAGRAVPMRAVVAVSGAAGAAALAVGATWPLLVLAVAGATATGVLALLRARELADLPATCLFALQLVLAYALVPFAGAGQSISHQWWEESLNTLGQGAFALAAYRLSRTPTLVRSTA